MKSLSLLVMIVIGTPWSLTNLSSSRCPSCSAVWVSLNGTVIRYFVNQSTITMIAS